MDEIVPTEPPAQKPTIPRALRRLVRKHIVAGDSNEQIRFMLARNGYEHPVSDTRLSHYRQDPKVKEMERQVELRVMQTGLAPRSHRIAALCRLAAEIQDKMYGVIPGEPDMPRMPVPMMPFINLSRTFLETVKHISILVDVDGPAANRAADAPHDARPVDERAFWLAMMNDALEAYLEKKQREQVPERALIEASDADSG